MIVDVNGKNWKEIGRAGENNHSVVRFLDAAAVYKEYPNASVVVLHQRPGDPAAYPITPSQVSVRDQAVYCTMTNGDLARGGEGAMQLVFYSEGTIVKTLVYYIKIGKSLDDSATPPEPWEAWVEQVINAGKHPPKIQDGTWWIWDAVEDDYVDTHTSATGGLTPEAKEEIVATILEELLEYSEDEIDEILDAVFDID